MSATAEEVLVTLKSIDAGIKALLAHFGGGPRAMERGGAPSGQGAVPHIASDADLDGKYGDPEVKAKSPRDWTGESMTGKKFSECPAEYLDLVASRLDYFAEQNAASESDDDRKKARFNRLDAARARGWAARIRAGYKPAEAAADGEMNVDDIPFVWLLPMLVALSAVMA